MKLDEFKQKYSQNPGFTNVLDFLIKNGYEHKEIMFNFEQAVLKEQEWIQSLNKKNNDIKDGLIIPIKKFQNGFKIVQLIDQASRNFEGSKMNHCLYNSSYSDDSIIYSLRDSKNEPHCTMELNGDIITQIKGFGNGKISPKYVNYILSFFKEINLEITNEDIGNLGYHPLSIELEQSISAFLLNYKILKIHDQKYIYTGNQLKLKKTIDSFDNHLFLYLTYYNQCPQAFTALLNLQGFNTRLIIKSFDTAACAGNIFALELYYNKYNKTILTYDIYKDTIYECIEKNQPESVRFLLSNINIKKRDLNELLQFACVPAYPEIMLPALLSQTPQDKRKKYYQKAYDIVSKSNAEYSITFIKFLIEQGVIINKKLNHSIFSYDDYKPILDLLISNGLNTKLKSNKIIIFQLGLSKDDKSMIDLAINLGLKLTRPEVNLLFKSYKIVSGKSKRIYANPLIDYYFDSIK